MRQVYALIEQVASSSASVLLRASRARARSCVARTIHNLSLRKNGAFVAINCSAIPETLMESELFGHERGAFTGAAARRLGCFELANARDAPARRDLGDAASRFRRSSCACSKTGRYAGSAASQEIPVDVRVLAATNRDPEEAVRRGTFREDLLYRLNVITVELPPLRRRTRGHPASRAAPRHAARRAARTPRASPQPGRGRGAPVAQLARQRARAAQRHRARRHHLLGRGHRAPPPRALPARAARARARRGHADASRRHAHRRGRAAA